MSTKKIKVLSIFSCFCVYVFLSVFSSFFTSSVYAAGKSEAVCFVSALNSNKVIDITGGRRNNGTNCQLYDRNSSAAQAFFYNYVGAGYYTLQLAGTDNMVLDVSGGTGYSGANVILFALNGNDNQLWCFENAGSGWYYIKSKTGFYLDVSGGTTANGTNIQVYRGNKTKSQKFKLVLNYSVSNAVAYAKKYTDNSGAMSGTYNSKYNIYKSDSLLYKGYDCANFGSQCLYAGGLVATSQWKPVYKGELYKNNTAKTTWVSADNLYRYLLSSGYTAANVKYDLSNIHEGDIVFIMNGSKASHTTICTGFSGSTPVYCAHSCWRKNYPYSYSAFRNAKVIDMSFSSSKRADYVQPKTSNVPAAASVQTYTIKSNSGAKVRANAALSGTQKGGLAKGSVVYYDSAINKDGYTWYHITKVESKSGSWGSFVGYYVANV